MQSVNKIHINNSTKLSLNDRFSSLHSAPSTAVTAARRNATIVNKASIRNRNLLAQLDQKHKLRAAIKIKRKSLRPNLRVAGTQRGSVGGRGGRAAATAVAVLRRNNLANAQSAAAAARLRRARNIAIMRADSERQPRAASINRRRRSVSANRGSGNNLAARLGVNASSPQQQQVPRRRLNRNTIVDHTRATSRSRSLVRNNALARSGSHAAREPSVQRRGRSASRNRRSASVVKQQQPIAQPRRQSVPGRQGRMQNVAPLRRAGRRAASATPVRSRLGVNRNKRLVIAQGAARRALTGVANGRVQKRRATVARKGQNAARPLMMDRLKVNPAQRQAPAQTRGRSQSRSRQPMANVRQPFKNRQLALNAQRQGNPNNRNVSQSNRSRPVRNAVPIAARVRARSNGNARKAPVQQRGRAKTAAQTPKTREQLDKELDQYMVNRSDM